MASIFTVQLHSLRFFAAHGLYKEEQSTGNEFEVNLTMTVDAPEEVVTAIDQTIDYSEVYRLIKEIFGEPTPLLETIAMNISKTLKQHFPLLKNIQIQIIKLHPPITNFIGSVSVTYRKDF